MTKRRNILDKTVDEIIEENLKKTDGNLPKVHHSQMDHRHKEKQLLFSPKDLQSHNVRAIEEKLRRKAMDKANSQLEEKRFLEELMEKTVNESNKART